MLVLAGFWDSVLKKNKDRRDKNKDNIFLWMIKEGEEECLTVFGPALRMNAAVQGQINDSSGISSG